MKRNITKPCIFLLFLAMAAQARAGDATVDNLTVNKDACFFGKVDVKPAAASLTNGLVLCYDFTTDTTPVQDLSGNNNAGTVSGATWTPGGYTNGAYYFDGDDTISAACNSSLQLNTWTLACWFKANTMSGADNLISRGHHLSTYRNYQLTLLGDRLYAVYQNEYGTDAAAEWSDSLQSNTWYHAAYVFDGSSTYLYVNGVLVSSHAQGITPGTDQTDDLQIGNYSGWPMDGYIDEVRVYNRGLTASEIYAVYSGAVAPNSGLLTVSSLVVNNSIAIAGNVQVDGNISGMPAVSLTNGATLGITALQPSATNSVLTGVAINGTIASRTGQVAYVLAFTNGQSQLIVGKNIAAGPLGGSNILFETSPTTSGGNMQMGYCSGGMMYMTNTMRSMGCAQLGYVAGSGAKFYQDGGTLGGVIQAGAAVNSGIMSAAGGTKYGVLQLGYSGGAQSSIIATQNCFGTMQMGQSYSGGRMLMSNAKGAMQLGYVRYGVVTNKNANGSLQLFNFENAGLAYSNAYMSGNCSIGLGAVTVTNDSAIVTGDGNVSHGTGSVTLGGGGLWVGNKQIAGANGIIISSLPSPVVTNGANASLSSIAAQALTLSGQNLTNWNAFATAAQGAKADNAVTNNQLVVNFAGLHTLTNGNVGIGTKDPISTLHVAGDVQFDGNMQAYNVQAYSNLLLGTGHAASNIAVSAYGSIQRGYNQGSRTIGSASYGSEQAGYNRSQAKQSITLYSHGAGQYGWNFNYAQQVISNNSYGAVQRGRNSAGIQQILDSAGAQQSGLNASNQTIISSIGSQQIGWNTGVQTIDNSYGASQVGANNGLEIIGPYAYGAQQLGFVDVNGFATNSGAGSIQLLFLSSNQVAVMTGKASLGLGACTVSNDQSFVAGNGQVSHGTATITAGGGFWVGNKQIADSTGVLYSPGGGDLGMGSFTNRPGQ